MPDVVRKSTLWPFAVAVLCLIYDNKWVLLFLVWLQPAPVLYYGIPMVMAVVEMLYWNWFAGWLARWLKDEEEFVRTTYRRFWSRFGGRILSKRMLKLAMDIWDWAVAFWKGQCDQMGRLNSRTGRFALWCLRRFPKVAGHPLMVVLGMAPLGWTIGIPIARSHKIRFGFSLLLASCLMANWALLFYSKGPLTFFFEWLGIL